MMKKLLSLVLACVLVLGLIPTVSAVSEAPWDTFIPSGGVQIPDNARIGRATLYGRASELTEIEPNDDYDSADRLYSEDVITAAIDGYDTDIFTFTIDKLSDVVIVGAAVADSLHLVTGRPEDGYAYFAEDMGYDSEYGVYGYLIAATLPAGTYYIVAEDLYYETSEYYYAITTIYQDHVHEWDEGVVTTAATCTKTGVKTFTCTSCETTKTESIAATGHSWDNGKITKEATCAADGVKTYTCTSCKTTKTSTIAATGNHTWDSGKITKEATCAAEGVKTYTCTVCKATKTSTIAATGKHVLTSEITKNPTCTTQGVKTYTCTGCGVTTTSAIAATGHSWDNGKITKEATCAADGVKTYTCTVCKATKTSTIAATGKHVLTSKVTKNPTCTAQGVKTYTCTGCGVTTTSAVAALGHNFVNNTCTRCRIAFGEHFVDVPSGSFYADAVKWAALNGVTTGVDDLHFGPNTICSRAQIVTFLWRAAGEPKVSGTNPFTDVPADSFYYNAVLWAVKNGITNGVDETHFAPNQNCSRAQIVTFLWRSAGKPKVSASNKFVDVPAGEFYYDAVLWAVKNGITSGTDDTHFSPNQNCNRAQAVTFLYRAKN